MRPLVSILMNCYNGESYLEKAINSIYDQTYENFEIVFVDNASTDQSASIAKSYDERLKYFRIEKNVPLGPARNFGLQYVCGEYLAFLDTDDIWLPNKLEVQLSSMDDDTTLLYSKVFHIDEHDKVIRETSIHRAPSFFNLLKKYDINMQSVIINLNYVNIVFDESLQYCPDYDIFMNIAVNNLKIQSLDKSLVKYRIHGESLSLNTLDIQVDEVKQVLQKIRTNNPELSLKYSKTFDRAISHLTHMVNAKRYILSNNYYDAAKEFLFISKYGIKYFLAALLLFTPWVNKYFYTKILAK